VGLADLYITLLDFGRAEQNAARAAQIRERYLGPEHPATLEALAEQALILCIGHPQKKLTAEGIARRVLTSRRRVLGPDHPDTLAIQARLAQTLNVLGRNEEAEDLAAQAEGLAAHFLGPEHDITLLARHILALVAEKRGDLDRAEALLQLVVAAHDQTPGVLDRESLAALAGLSRVAHRQGRLDEARRVQLRTLNRYVQAYGLVHIRLSGVIDMLFTTLKAQRDYATIRDLCEGWIRDLLAMPPELDQSERHRHSLRLSRFALTLATLPEPTPFDGELAVRAAEEGAKQGNDTQDNNWTWLSLVHLRLGHIERAEWAVRESMRRCKGDCFDSVVQALIHARRGELDETRAWFDRAARENGRNNRPPGTGYKEVRDEVAALLGVNDLPADVFAGP
jgi:tetratricopeptide (TPR) repeat protein